MVVVLGCTYWPHSLRLQIFIQNLKEKSFCKLGLFQAVCVEWKFLACQLLKLNSLYFLSLKCTVHNQTMFSSEHRESFNESWQNRNICLRNSKCQIFITLLPWIASILTHTTLWGPPDFLMTYGDTSLWSVRTSKVFCTRLLLLMLWGNFYISPFIRLSGQQQKKIQQGLCVVCKFPPSGQLCHCNKTINCNQDDV